MSERIPKRDWAPGPWQDEPDRLFWKDEETGYECLAYRSSVSGSLCGYVGVKRRHPAWKIHYTGCSAEAYKKYHESYRRWVHLHGWKSLDAEKMPATPKTIKGIGEAILELDVHGGLTFSDFMANRGRDSVWHFGFDTGHAFDFMPAMDALLRKIGSNLPQRDEEYRDLKYVRGEVSRLAQQIKMTEKHFAP